LKARGCEPSAKADGRTLSAKAEILMDGGLIAKSPRETNEEPPGKA
jgi:hypothetical protein